MLSYDRRLRQRFQRLFVLSNRLRSLYLNPLLLNRVLRAAARRPEINTLLTEIVIGNRGIAEGVSLKTLLKVVLPG